MRSFLYSKTVFAGDDVMFKNKREKGGKVIGFVIEKNFQKKIQKFSKNFRYKNFWKISKFFSSRFLLAE